MTCSGPATAGGPDSVCSARRAGRERRGFTRVRDVKRNAMNEKNPKLRDTDDGRVADRGQGRWGTMKSQRGQIHGDRRPAFGGERMIQHADVRS